jgi:anti-sigma28 factor (negative regulator of flagellin synthesis)
MKPDQPQKDQPNKQEEKEVKLIKTREQFLERINDMRSKISGIKFIIESDFVKEEDKIEKIKKAIENGDYGTFDEFLGKFNEELSIEGMEKDESYQEIIDVYNDFMERVRTFKNIKELENIIKDEKDYFRGIK